jgi:hypothetical protein
MNMQSPFKFLDSYTKPVCRLPAGIGRSGRDDKDIFFGRELDFEGCLRFVKNSKCWGFCSVLYWIVKPS